MALDFTKEERKKLFVATYLIYKGYHYLNDEIASKVIKPRFGYLEAKKFFEKNSEVAQAIARLNEEYLFLEDEIETEHRHEEEEKIYDWLEKNAFTKEFKTKFPM